MTPQSQHSDAFNDVKAVSVRRWMIWSGACILVLVLTRQYFSLLEF